GRLCRVCRSLGFPPSPGGGAARDVENRALRGGQVLRHVARMAAIVQHGALDPGAGPARFAHPAEQVGILSKAQT
ncbi:hypothetical protein ACI394_30130, partial [Klebsiella pneumoniae]|uniref:hypothetical protein n=1 Tax=Klebsiella pneumoniae TaxID=573 RepID=UPI003852B040